MSKKFIKRGNMVHEASARENKKDITINVSDKDNVVDSSLSSPMPSKTSALEEAVKQDLQVESELDQAPVHEEKEHEFLAFVISGEEYGVDIMMIKEIIRPVGMTHVPRVPDYVKGIISLRGAVVPIFDMKKRLGLNAQEPGKKSRIVVVSLGTNLVGFWADSVTEVVKLKESGIEPPPPTLLDGPAQCIRGVGHFRGRMIIVLDVDKVLKPLDLSLTIARGGHLSKSESA
jgi:purine-binding chemotaxis protein CheW